jgi:hypothetical protein
LAILGLKVVISLNRINTMGDKEPRPSHSSASTLEEERRPGVFKEKLPQDEISHDENTSPALPSNGDETERAKVVRKMSQTALNAMLENPLAGQSRESVIRDARKFAQDHGMADSEEDFVKGALVAQRPNDFENIPELSEEDKATLRYEIAHKWRQPFTLYFLVSTSSEV